MNEAHRQFFHIALGLFFMLLLFSYGREASILLLFCATLFALMVIHLRTLRVPLPVLDWFFSHFERRGASADGSGALWYLCGMLLLCTFLQNVQHISASFFILSVGDGASTLAGKYFGAHPLPFNKKKSLEGTFAFALSCIPIFFLWGAAAFAISIACAAVESLPLEKRKIKIDDNLSIALTSLLLFSLI